MVYNDVSVGQLVFINLPRALTTLIFMVLYHKIIDVILTLICERDFFKSGHLQFVHSLKEGLIMVDNSLKNTKLINIAARQMLQLPFSENDSPDTSCFEQLVF